MPERATVMSRSEKSAEAVVAGDRRGEGPNEKESRSAMSISEEQGIRCPGNWSARWRARVKPRESRRSGEAAAGATWKRALRDERPDGAGVTRRRTCSAALKRVKANKGSAGVDGMTVDETARLPARRTGRRSASSCSRARTSRSR